MCIRDSPTASQQPSLFVEKTAAVKESGAYGLGDTIPYMIKVVNNGNVTVTDITVTDDLTGNEWTIDQLEPGAYEEYQAEYTVTEADVMAGKVVNVATAEGTDPEGEKVSKEDTETVETEISNPHLTVVKETTSAPANLSLIHISVTKETTSTPANGEAYALGETITYKITAANDGNLTLKNVVVTDELTGDEWTIDSLAPGQSSEAFTASHKVTQKDILNGSVVNEATAAGKSPDPDKPDPGVEPGETEDPTVDPNGHLTVTKETTSTPENGAAYALGETITYKVTATNDGNLTLKNVVVTDELTGDKWTIESLKPGDVYKRQLLTSPVISPSAVNGVPSYSLVALCVTTFKTAGFTVILPLIYLIFSFSVTSLPSAL